MNSATRRAVRSMSRSATVSTGVCMARRGMPRRPQGIPERATWMAHASVPEAPGMGSTWKGISTAFAAATSLSKIRGWKFGPIETVGPPSIFAVSGPETPGCWPKVTSIAIAAIGVDPVRAGDRALQARLLLHGCHRVHVPRVAAPGELLHAQDQGGHGSPVVQALGRRVSPREGEKAGIQRDHVPDAHECLDLCLRQPDIHEELLEGDGLLLVGGLEEVRRHAHDEGGQETPGVHRHLLTEEDPGVEAPDLRHLQEALLDPADHEGDLVHVTGQHDRRPGRGAETLLDRDEAPQGVLAQLVGKGGEPRAHEAPDLRFVARGAARFGELLHEGGCVHAPHDTRSVPHWEQLGARGRAIHRRGQQPPAESREHEDAEDGRRGVREEERRGTRGPPGGSRPRCSR